jgi:bifunctional non-homologous end joining protein LigD
MRLEGLVSKHRESTYRGGRSDRWIKMKNRQHPSFSSALDQFG